MPNSPILVAFVRWHSSRSSTGSRRWCCTRTRPPRRRRPISVPNSHPQFDSAVPIPIVTFHSPHSSTDSDRRMDFDYYNIDHDSGHRNYPHYCNWDFYYGRRSRRCRRCRIDCSSDLGCDRRCNMTAGSCRCTGFGCDQSRNFRRTAGSRCCGARRIDNSRLDCIDCYRRNCSRNPLVPSKTADD